MRSKPGSVFKRWETDDELRKRILAKFPNWHAHMYWRIGKALDAAAEEAELQRRLIEDER